MAAAQKFGRICACGCGHSIDDRGASARFSVECYDRRVDEFRQARDAREAKKRKPPRAAELSPQRNMPTDPEHRTTIVCKACQGYPWVRRPDRLMDNSDLSVGVAEGQRGWVCRECAGVYQPEPEPERGSAIRSSAGTAVRHGALYGIEKESAGNGSVEYGIHIHKAKK